MKNNHYKFWDTHRLMNIVFKISRVTHRSGKNKNNHFIIIVFDIHTI